MKLTAKEYVQAHSIPCPTTGCWLWTGELTQDGYGMFKVRLSGGKRLKRLAHRVSYEAFTGPLLDGAYALHVCDVRCCVNPAHIYAGTHKKNMEDMIRRGRGRPKQEFCRKGHPKSGDNLLGAKGACKACRYAYKLAKFGHVRR